MQIQIIRVSVQTNGTSEWTSKGSLWTRWARIKTRISKGSVSEVNASVLISRASMQTSKCNVWTCNASVETGKIGVQTSRSCEWISNASLLERNASLG